MDALIKQLLEYAPILGAGLTFLLVTFAIASYIFKSWYHGRLEAIKRAAPEDLPSIVGDEIDKLGLKAEGLSRKDTFELVKTALDQRENRSKRSFYAFLLISLFVFILALIGIMQDPIPPQIPQGMLPAEDSTKHLNQPNFEPMAGSIVLNSDPGDYIGDGKNWEFTNNNGVITAAATENSVTINFRGDDNWELIFEAPEGKELVSGTYDSAQRAPFHNPVKPGLEVSGAGRGCNQLSGRFDVFSIERGSNNKLIKFEASFEQNCDSSTGVLTGKVNVSSAK